MTSKSRESVSFIKGLHRNKLRTIDAREIPLYKRPLYIGKLGSFILKVQGDAVKTSSRTSVFFQGIYGLKPSFIKFYKDDGVKENEIKILLILGDVPFISKDTVFQNYLGNYLRKEGLELKHLARVDLVIQIACAIKYLHEKGILHCNISSDTVWLNGSLIQLAEFGVSKVTGTQDQNNILESSLYLDPRAKESKNYSIKSETYSFGVLMWEVMTSKPPIPYILENKRDYWLELVSSGVRLPLTGIQEEVAALIDDCWGDEPPSFGEIILKLKSIYKKSCNLTIE
ncbi:hypothetical protein DICPUDRAFT_85033 [Dictyostelium purpureum]|uniref:Protein kinase domain-containing protein n=1 Tax=Dictyostelium purpureum TaxID=5786 RepID=F1A4H4_DICPU|nr:uncharacterized protein DICPUDRAFT_85033 [Dictyostelium purpureum]EGC28906.1 hypothetical protein DICPUDRAFT_85033 [Dictyostelium purpureum]|eukprot:XP_003294571.1 hypothetical protein DICPUDRAFT_85033 [Dictyostelium purpureum]